MSSGSSQRSRLEFLDAVRGVAALYVMLYHARELLFEGFHNGATAEAMDPFSRTIAYTSISLSFAHQAVVLFFVLSGFVIHLRYARSLHESQDEARLDVGRFYYRRIRRLGPALILAFVLTLALDLIGTSQAYALYAKASPYSDINALIFNDHDLGRGLGYFLLGSGLQTWGTNTPLWSLRLEIWFYALYPILWLLARRHIVLTALVVALAFLADAFVFKGGGVIRAVFIALPSWWAGALLAESYVGRLAIPLARMRWLAILLAGLPILQLSPLAPVIGEPLLDIAWACGFVGLLAWLLHGQDRIADWRIWHWLKPLGDSSYTLYVIHFPIFVLMGAWLMAQSGDGTLPRHPGWIPVGAAIALISAYLLHFIVEKPFMTAPRRRPQ
ncbi:MAG: acyltransferase [Chloroflexi bacterium]|nr:acyltransferase [Chloroflexota bacterium]